VNSFDFLFKAIVGGFFEYCNDLISSWYYSVPTILISIALGFVVYRATLHFYENPYVVWAFTGGCVAFIAAVLRPGLVYGGFVRNLQGVDCFSLNGLQIWSYLLFVFSGEVAGIAIAKWHRQPLTFIAATTGIVLGVLFHYSVAQGWMTTQLYPRIALGGIEFLAPAGFALALTCVWNCIYKLGVDD